MKNFKFILLLGMAFSFSAMASLQVESVTLNDDSTILVSDIVHTDLNNDQTVNFIELKDGSRVEGDEVKNVTLSRESKTLIKISRRAIGDGSGG